MATIEKESPSLVALGVNPASPIIISHAVPPIIN